ncbi:SIMPL domain-containing protein [Leptospira borgpetersenii]|uniref:SIMPL domain-containing protein n=1 Tax=Leptospira borgpetersenii TaxID=174 RepID=UPI000774A93D|nr:SIMPL domain-containing protein [Leptospira borgpetersenii]MBE8399735.1 SIMPL domain-containing protein [Leptospira borgpetersenii serovar Tarassovi]MBE8402847.1 SIMPL domain-containing protein [Leptospira borgpetersenii serovar Tarassovi]MBE8405899.1 SIMPL domain-containing protein [Leptospira borgpetersenii serovar Tarassovi]MBE8412250.1 SIMPL domain-containing protein [Leptospira borgpetersenii serovar Tarassovi]MBE8415275.1 SIMPL domain-containing protein [Leptospira borgpetersenii sero
MKKLLALLLLTIPFLGIVSETKQTITVSGSGSAIVETDYVQMNFSVEVEDPEPKAAQEKNLERTTNVIKTLSKGFKIATKDIYSTDYTLQRQYLQEGKQRPYLASSGILLKLRDLKLYKDLLLEVQKLGVNNVSGIEFKADSTKKQEKEALTAAYEDAKNKALVLAKSIGKTNVIALKVVESDSMLNPQVVYLMGKVSSDHSPISIGERTIQTKVNVEFEIQ